MSHNEEFSTNHRPPRPRRGPRQQYRDLNWGSDNGFDAFGRADRPRGRRRGRKGGDVRAATLLLLAEAPAHGYHLIHQISERSEGAWKPSPGSIYPVLQQLEDEGFIEFERVEGRKTARLTGTGENYVNEHREALGTPWNVSEFQRGRHAEQVALHKSMRTLAVAARQVADTGTPEQNAEAAAVIAKARQQVYGILAADSTDAE